jgi:ATP-binding cassette subfamily F protein uup
MAYKDRHALENLPGEIAALQARIVKLRTLMSDPDFFARSPALIEQASTELAASEAALATAEDRWLELALLREELDG